jgi:hypothetical protein
MNIILRLFGFEPFDPNAAKPSPFEQKRMVKQHPISSNIRPILDTGLFGQDMEVVKADNTIILETKIINNQSQMNRAIKEGFGTSLSDAEIAEASNRNPKVPIANVQLVKPYWIKGTKAVRIFRDGKTGLSESAIQRAIAVLNAASQEAG